MPAHKAPLILTIDDEPAIRDSISHFLTDYDYDVITAVNGREGLALFEEKKPDLILVDLRMPEMDGLEVLERVNRSHPDQPIIIISGTGIIADAIQALHLGAWDYLLKPIEDMSVLRYAVERALERAHLIRENRAYQTHLEEEVSRRTAELEQANAELHQINNRLRRIVETTQKISPDTDIDQFGSRLLEEFGHHMLASGGSLYMTKGDGLRLIHSLDPGHAPDFIPFPLKKGSIFQRMLNDMQPILVKDIQRAAGYTTSGWGQYKDSSLLAFPLADEDGQNIALLSLHSKTPPPFIDQDKEIGSILASCSCESLKAARATEALRESEEKFRNITISAQDAIIMMTAEGRISFWNHAAEKIFGYTQDEVADSNFLERMVPLTYHHRIRKRIEQLWEEIEGQDLGDPLELEARQRDGTLFPIEFALSKFNLKGRRHVVGIIRNLTERKRQERKRKKSEKKFRSYIDNAPNAIFVVDQKGNYREVNQAASRMTGYSLDELLQMNLLDLVPPESQRKASSYFDQVTQTGKATTAIPFIRKDGGLGHWSITAVKLSQDRFLEFAKDITDERKLEIQLRQAQKMESIGTLAGGIAHDFNNILSSILGYTELTLTTLPEDDNQIRHFISAVLRAGERARELVGQILTFSRQGEQIYAPVEIHLIVKEALKLLRSSLPATIEIHQKIPVTGRVIADPTQIHQVIMNLCTNAYHAMEKSGGTLTVELSYEEIDLVKMVQHPDLAPGTHLKLTVSDTGKGMTPAIMERIFDPYFTTKEKGKGTGLGLAVVHGIVKSHQGAITVESTPGEGTIFSVFLPATGADEEEKPAPVASLPMGVERILLVDDEQEIVEIQQQMLQRLGYRVTPRESSLEALETFRTAPHNFDVVVTDLTMPNMTGERLTQELIRLRPDIPVILCTGFSEMIDEKKAVAMGIKKFLLKPVSMVDFAMAVREVLEES